MKIPRISVTKTVLMLALFGKVLSVQETCLNGVTPFNDNPSLHH